MVYVEDKRLALPDGRTLAYADNGNTSSLTLVLSFHGTFDVGDASRLPPALIDKNVHLITPSLPGWGHSSPVPANSSYEVILAADITALITFLHPGNPNLTLYISGSSFGTIAAQILYGLPYVVFPLGRCIAGLLLLSPVSPPHCHKDYAKSMTWQDYLLKGPPTRYLPFNLVARLAKYMLASKLTRQDTALAFTRRMFFDPMGEAERDVFASWRDANGVAEGQLENDIAAKMVRSVAQTWQGFLGIPTVFHSGWGGFCPDHLDDEHARHPVLIVLCKDDRMASAVMARWLVANYKNAWLRCIDGNCVSGILRLDEIWKEFLTHADDA